MNLDTWQEIIATLRNNKLRGVMTAAGVFWGVGMLVAILGFAGGLRRDVAKNMAGFATNAVHVWSQRTTMPYAGMQPGRRIKFDNADAEAIIREVEGIEHFAPRVQLGGWRGGDNVTRGTKTGDFTVGGDYPAMQHIQEMRFLRGRFVNDLDIRDRRKVVVIGPQAYEQLYEPGENPIGTHVKIQGVYFTVVGQFEPAASGGHMTERLARSIFIPFTTFQQAFNVTNVGWFSMTARADYDASKVERDVKQVLAQRHKVHPVDANAFGSFNVGERFGKMASLAVGIKLLGWFVGIMTLLAGAIGVSNIMLIVVKERTKEIGVKKALGATPFSIVAQIIQESTILTAIAGYFGLVAGVFVLSMYPDKAEQVDISVALIATGVLIVAGALAGLLPAVNAARINPVEALRAE